MTVTNRRPPVPTARIWQQQISKTCGVIWNDIYCCTMRRPITSQPQVASLWRRNKQSLEKDWKESEREYAECPRLGQNGSEHSFSFSASHGKDPRSCRNSVDTAPAPNSHLIDRISSEYEAVNLLSSDKSLASKHLSLLPRALTAFWQQQIANLGKLPPHQSYLCWCGREWIYCSRKARIHHLHRSNSYTLVWKVIF